MTHTLTLIVPNGAQDAPISHGIESFSPYREDHTNPASRWLVEVSREAAVHFLHNAGFALYERPGERAVSSATMVQLRHPDGCGCGWDGVAYEADENGIVTVPAEAAADLESHGFGPPICEEMTTVVSVAPAPPEVPDHHGDDDHAVAEPERKLKSKK